MPYEYASANAYSYFIGRRIFSSSDVVRLGPQVETAEKQVRDLLLVSPRRARIVGQSTQYNK